MRICVMRFRSIGHMIATTLLVLFSGLVMAQIDSKQFTREDGLPSEEAHHVRIDHHGLIWVTTSKGLASYDGFRFKRYDATSVGLTKNLQNLQIDHKNRIWVSDNQGGVAYLEDGQFIRARIGDTAANFGSYRLPSLVLSDSNATIFFGSKAIYKMEDTLSLVWSGQELFGFGLRPVVYELEDHRVTVETHLGRLILDVDDGRVERLETFEEGSRKAVALGIAWPEGKAYIPFYQPAGRLVVKWSGLDTILNLESWGMAVAYDFKFWQGKLLACYDKYVLQVDSSGKVSAFDVGVDVTLRGLDIDVTGTIWGVCLHEGIIQAPRCLRQSEIINIPSGNETPLRVMVFGNGKYQCLDRSGRLWVFDQAWTRQDVWPASFDVHFREQGDSNQFVVGTENGLFIGTITDFSRMESPYIEASHEPPGIKHYARGQAVYSAVQLDKEKWLLAAKDTLFLSGEGYADDAIELPVGREQPLLLSVDSTITLLTDADQTWMVRVSGGQVAGIDSLVNKTMVAVEAVSSEQAILLSDDSELMIWNRVDNSLEELKFVDCQKPRFVEWMLNDEEYIVLMTNKGGIYYSLDRAGLHYRGPVLTTLKGVVQDLSIRDGRVHLLVGNAIQVLGRDNLTGNDGYVMYKDGQPVVGNMDQYPVTIPKDVRHCVFTFFRPEMDIASIEWTYDQTVYRSESNVLELQNLDAGMNDVEAYIITRTGEKIGPIRIDVNNKVPLSQHPFTYWVLGLLGFVLLTGFAFLRWRRTQNRRLERSVLREQFTKSQIRALQTQINPHFMFNSLNTFQYLVRNDEKEKSLEYLAKFSDLLRDIVSMSGDDLITLEDEIRVLKRYVEVEQMRLKEDVKFEFDVDPTIQTKEVGLPPMVIQPLLENAIWHGASRGENGTVRVRFSMDRGLNVTIEDNGPGLTEKSREKKKHKSYALGNIRKRLQNIQQIYGQISNLEVVDLKEENKSGTRQTLRLPQIKLLV